jgi:DNA-directed RNA polymerase specialized sigma24 family protein
MTPADPWDDRTHAWSERLAFARRVLSNSRFELTPEDREDLAQEALADLFVQSRSERPLNPEGLLRTIAQRKAIDLVRARARWRRLFDGSETALADAASPLPGPDSALRMRLVEAMPAIATTWFRLHRPDCLPHARTYFDDGAWKDLAAEKDLRVNTVIQQWSRCRNAFVAHLRACGMGWALGDE